MKSFKYKNYIFLIGCLLILTGVLRCDIYGKYDERLFPAMERTRTGDLYGYINGTGKWVVEPAYDQTYPFSDGVGVIVKDDLYGLVNERGKTILTPIYQSITPFEEERGVFVSEQGMGVLDKRGKVISKKVYSYVENYEDGVAVVGETQKDGRVLNGYIDRMGKEVIPPTYDIAYSFDDGKALVKEREGIYHIIDKSGKVLSTLEVANAYGLSDNRVVFSQTLGGLSGYMDEKGQIIIEPIYQSAQAFEDGVAVVSTAPYFFGEQGLIDKNGKYIYPNKYNEIQYLGEDRVALGKAIDENEPLKGSIYAIGDTKGNMLTDFIYYGVSEYEGDRASAYDRENTYFIDLSGEKINSLPTLVGTGTLVKEGNVIVADLDYVTSYVTSGGKVIYEPNQLIELGNDYRIRVEKYKPNINYLAYEPQVEGMTDLGIQVGVNKQLMELSGHKEIKEDEALDYTYYANFDVQYYNKNLLVLKLVSSTYPFGAAHPMPTMQTPVINLVTGKFYKLDDLFKSDVDWKSQLNTILQDMVKNNMMYDTLFEGTKVMIEDNQNFYVDQEALYIYYPPYDIGPYSSGFITFRIPYTEISSLLNQNGDFWKAYH